MGERFGNDSTLEEKMSQTITDRTLVKVPPAPNLKKKQHLVSSSNYFQQLMSVIFLMTRMTFTRDLIPVDEVE